MTNEEIQRTMEFILEQQAQFAASIQRAEEQRIRDTPRLTRLEESFQSLTELAQITDWRLDRLEEHQIYDNERLTNLEDSYQLLIQIAQNSEGRLDRIEDSHQVLVQLAQKMDIRLERLERPGA
jgi:hypothetical protein